MAFLRWTTVTILAAGLSGCLGGGSDRPTSNEKPAAEQNATAPAKGKGEKAAAKGDSDDAPAAKGDSDDAPAKGSGKGGGGIDPSKLKIVEGKGWLDSEQGFLKIAGEVKNETGQWITSVRVTIRLYDASGKEIGTDSITTEVAKDLGEEVVERVYSDRTYVPPGETAVFYFLRDVKKIKGTYASHKLAVRAFAAENPPTMALTGFKADKDADGRFDATGTIENKGGVGCRSPKLVLGIYSPEGTLLSTLTETPDAMFQKVLGPGQTVAAERKNITPDGQAIGSVKGWADCEPPN